MNGHLLPIPVVALTVTLTACSDRVVEHVPDAGPLYSVGFTLWTGPPAYFTTPPGEPELFSFSASHSAFHASPTAEVPSTEEPL
jgi:hypothetical protein